MTSDDGKRLGREIKDKHLVGSAKGVALGVDTVATLVSGVVVAGVGIGGVVGHVVVMEKVGRKCDGVSTLR